MYHWYSYELRQVWPKKANVSILMVPHYCAPDLLAPTVEMNTQPEIQMRIAVLIYKG